MIPCGVVGAGAIGRGLAASLVRAGYPVGVYDLDPEAAAAAAASGASVAGSALELARGSRVVLLALPDTPEIMAVLADGLEQGLEPGATLILTSTVAPETPRELEARLATRGVGVLDAPLSGGPVRAASGQLAMMVGGPEPLFEEQRPLLQALASHLVYVGPTGHGQVAKLVNNLMGMVILVGISEGLALAARADADLERVCAAIAGGSGSSWILREWLPDTAFAGSYERRFSLDLMHKDVGLIGDLAAGLEVPVPALEFAGTVFERAIAAGYGGYDFSVVAALAAQAVGRELPGGPAPPPRQS